MIYIDQFLELVNNYEFEQDKVEFIKVNYISLKDFNVNMIYNYILPLFKRDKYKIYIITIFKEYFDSFSKVYELLEHISLPYRFEVIKITDSSKIIITIEDIKNLIQLCPTHVEELLIYYKHIIKIPKNYVYICDNCLI